MIIEAFVAVLAALCVLNAWVTWRVVHDDLSSSGQRLAQTVLMWLVPAVGALIVLNLQRRDGEKGSGRYRDRPDPGEDFGHPRLSAKEPDDVADDRSPSRELNSAELHRPLDALPKIGLNVWNLTPA